MLPDDIDVIRRELTRFSPMAEAEKSNNVAVSILDNPEIFMKNQKKLACTLAVLAAFPLAAAAETADGGKDSTSLATTNDYVNSGSIVRKDDDKIRIFND